MATLIQTYFIFSKMSLRERLFFNLFFRDIDLFLLVLRMGFFHLTFFRTVFVPTPFANVFILLRPLTTSSTYRAAHSNKTASNHLQLGQFFSIKGIAALPRTCARAPKHIPRCVACPQKMRKSAEF